MINDWKIACATAALLAIAGSAAAAPKGSHGASSLSDHPAAPPATSNRQSLPDADRGLDRAEERESEQGLDNSEARDQQIEHALDRGAGHRNAHSLEPHGKDGKHTPN